MKIVTEKNDIESSGAIAQSNFGIVYNAKIARMLSEQVYSDPILAVIREYTCNAWDAHKLVGKESEPVVIHLPNPMEPVWSVRDFGPGLSQAQIMGTEENEFKGLFNTYGNSGKDDSNLFIGGFGVGSKAGFAYTKQDSAFTVTSWHDGIKNVFTCMMGEVGIPGITLMHCEASNEPSGVEISIPIKTKDITAVLERTEKVVKYATTLPKFTGAELKLKERTYVMSGDGWRRRSLDTWSKSVAVIGGVGYPIDANQFSGTASEVANARIEIDVPIGEVELSLSRESLSYDNRTIAYLTDRLERIAEEIKKHYQESFDGKKSYWEKCVAYNSANNDHLSGVGSSNYYHRSKILKKYLKVEYAQGAEISVPQRHSLKDARTVKYRQSASFYPNKHIVLVWNDTTSTRIQPKFNRLYEQLSDKDIIVLVKTASRKKFKEIWAKLGGCPRVIHLNALEDLFDASEEARIRSVRDKADKKRNLSYLINSYSASAKGYFGKPYEFDLSKDEETYYVWSKAGFIYDNPECTGNGLHPSNVVRSLIALNEAGVSDVWTKRTMVIPPTYECHVVNKTNYVNVLDLLKKLELTDEILKQAAAHNDEEDSKIAHFVEGYHRYFKAVDEYKTTDLHRVAEAVKSKPGHDANKIAHNRYTALKNVKDSLGAPVQPLPVVPAKRKLDLSRYPMLSILPQYYYMDDSKYKTVVNYILEQETKNVSLQPT